MEVKTWSIFIWITAILLVYILDFIKADPIVYTKLGKVRGTILTSDNNEPFYAFRGIPYAKPPLNQLRFTPPEPVEKWNNILDATEYGQHCLQLDVFRNLITGDEDCLYLNVYTKQLAGSTLQPVMVFIHGGDFNSGKGSSHLYGQEQRLVDKDIVLVTFNYRLSALGFLSTEDVESSGNYGLLDQVEALKWIQNNVESFGGDPTSVTIIGEIDGSESVIYHLISSLSKGLFHAAIGQSGTASNIFTIQDEPLKQTKILAEVLNCPTENSEKLVNCLRTKSASEIMIKSSMLEFSNPLMLQFGPVVDKGVGAKVEFLTEHPKSLLKKLQFNKVPVLFGNVNNEGYLYQLLSSMTVGGITEFDKEHLLKTFSELNKHYNNVRKLEEEANTYNSDVDLLRRYEKTETLSDALGNLFINTELEVAVKAFTDSGVPTYVYHLTYSEENNTRSQLYKFLKEDYYKILKLVSHIDDLQHLFRRGFFPNELKEIDKRTSEKMITLWTNFAKNKTPSFGDGNADNESLVWNLSQPNQQTQYLNSGKELCMEKGTFCSRPDLRKEFQEKNETVTYGNENPIVETKSGLVRGSNMTTDYDKVFYAFRGVPYGKPTTDNLRFMPPEPAEKWEGIYDATKDGNDCTQYNLDIEQLTGDEDCLHLNIYSAKLSNSTRKPVMVFIYGGGFQFGSSLSTVFGPQRLLDKNIVLVTINYRMSALGFLCTQDAISPGNYGMLDQVLALKWIQENILNFGGDPNSVTIFGESAGAASVSLHVVSPQSKGLFHGAIHESGTATQGWVLQRDPTKLTVQLAKSLNCPTNSSQEIVDCLRKQKATDIVLAAKDINFIPVVDASYRKIPFLPDNPNNLFQNDKFNKVPSIIGINRNEGYLFLLSAAIQYGIPIDHFSLKQFVPFIMRDTPLNKTVEMWTSLAEEYFTNFNLTNATQNVEAYTNLFGDIMFNCFTDQTIEMMSSKGVPVYSYDLTYQGEHSIIDTIPQGSVDYLKLLKIVTHTDEQPYLFHTRRPNVTKLNEEDRKISDLMLSLWTNFATNKVPTLTRSNIRDDPSFQWTPTNATHLSYLDIDSTKPYMKLGNLCTRPELWRKDIKN